MGRSLLGWGVLCWDGAFFVGMGRSLLGWGVLCWEGAFFVGMGRSLLGWGVLCWEGAFFVGMGRSLLGRGVLCWDGAFFVGMGRSLLGRGVLFWDGAFFVGMGRSLLGWGVLCWEGAFFVGKGRSLLGWGVLCWNGAFFVGKERGGYPMPYTDRRTRPLNHVGQHHLLDLERLRSSLVTFFPRLEFLLPGLKHGARWERHSLSFSLQLFRDSPSERHELCDLERASLLTPVSRAVAHLARASLSITKRKERDCVQSRPGAYLVQLQGLRGVDQVHRETVRARAVRTTGAVTKKHKQTETNTVGKFR